MVRTIDQVYEAAVKSRLLPGVSLMAGDENGNIIYSRSLGKASSRDGDERPFAEDTICTIASMTKLMTSVAALQCVEDGLLDLDAPDIREKLPRIGSYGIITGFDDEKNEAVLEPDSTPISLRMLLSHTSGHEYDWLSPSLGKWRASRNEQPWAGPTIEHKSVLPLVFKPGTGFAYGAGHDWAGKLIQEATGSSLEDYMRRRVWIPLGIEKDTSFFPEKNEDMKKRMATISTLQGKEGKAPAIDAPGFDVRLGGTDCFGGGGVYTSPKAFYTFLSAVLRQDPRLLKPESYEELFRPQLSEAQEQSFNDYLVLSPAHSTFLGLGIPTDVRKTWSFAGMVAKGAEEGRFESGTTLWAGVPSVTWFIDRKLGVCGTTFCQILPPMHPTIVEMHVEFQRGVFEEQRRRVKSQAE